MIKLQVRVLRLTKMHDYLNVPPCIICTPCIIWFRHSTRGIFGLWAFRKCLLLCVSNVHNQEYAPLKQNRCIFLYILVWNIFSDLYVTCGLLRGVAILYITFKMHCQYILTVQDGAVMLTTAMIQVSKRIYKKEREIEYLLCAMLSWYIL